MQIGAFELQEPVPTLREPRLLAALRPWIDVGSVGTMALAFLEESWQARPLARLSQPGTFYDFTRYRPAARFREGQREISIPNTFLHYAQSSDGQDWLLLHALEPHSHGEEYVQSLMSLMKYLGVRQYCLIGSMYAPVPHTRPPLASGSASDDALRERLQQLGVRESSYEGPTTILSLVTIEARQQGVDTLGVILQLPAYAQLERDYLGLHALLELLAGLYGLSLNIDSVRQEGDRQRVALDHSVQQDPRMQNMVRELEALYDAEAAAGPQEEAPKLSAEMERFLRDIESHWNEPEPE